MLVKLYVDFTISLAFLDPPWNFPYHFAKTIILLMIKCQQMKLCFSVIIIDWHFAYFSRLKFEVSHQNELKWWKIQNSLVLYPYINSFYFPYCVGTLWLSVVTLNMTIFCAIGWYILVYNYKAMKLWKP